MSRLKLREMLKRHEGVNLKLYRDPYGTWTIGCGHNVEANPLPIFMADYLRKNAQITYEMVDKLLDQDIDTATLEVANFAWFKALDDVRQDVVVDMIFNLGMTRFSAFKAMISCLQTQDFAGASREMLASRWAAQVKGRAQELSLMMETGAYAQ